MTLSETLSNINLALNYPALTYEDIKLYFDMAIAELNTTLHTSLPTVSTMITEFRQYSSKPCEKVLNTDPETNNYGVSDSSDITTGTVGIYIRDGIPEKYICVQYGTSKYWVKYETIDSCDISEYLPDDWVLLWLIPYVCFKYTVRDGGTAQTFAEELQQGFQQLQETYDVPAKVTLATYADKLAYHNLVEKKLPNLDIMVGTRAIYENMKHDRSLNAIYSNMFDRGGF